MNKNFFWLIIVALIAFGAFEYFSYSGGTILPTKQEAGETSLCYYYSKQTTRGSFNKAWLRMNITGEKVTGEYQNLPAETDSKTGTFEGTTGPFDQKIYGHIADVWWDSLAEGMRVKEELKIEYGEGSAVVLFGEMVDRGDGVYVYKDNTKLTPGFNMSQTDCGYLDQRLEVEKYLRANISVIADSRGVLGGKWYVVSVYVNPTFKTGEVVYEDGHIQRKSTFSYQYNERTKGVTISNFRSR